MIANVILVLGQSNAMSYSTAGVPYPGGWVVNTQEVIWKPTGGWNNVYQPGVTSHIPLAGGGIPWGPEAPIALAKRALHPQRATYIFKYVLGGCGLAQAPGDNDWSPYSMPVAGLVKMFPAFVTDLLAALNQIASTGRIAMIDECYWIGNESDCLAEDKATAIMRDLPMLAAAIRAKFVRPDMKFIVARTKDTLGWVGGSLPYVSDVRAAQEACGNLRRNAWVNTDDLASGAHSAGHYDMTSIVTLGQRLFAAAESIID